MSTRENYLQTVTAQYRPRIADQMLSRQLKASGAVLIEGPKWCGKTWTGINASRSRIFLDSPDRRPGYLQTAEAAPSILLRGETPRLLDEWQTVPTLWDTVRHEVDLRHDAGQFILTGSAVPYSGTTLHTGTGRIARLRMRPMSMWESGESSGEVSLTQLFGIEKEPPVSFGGENPWGIEQLAQIMVRGGWPDLLAKNQEAAILQNQNYLDAVIHEDISRLDNTERNPERMYAVLRSIARNTSTEASKAAILADIAATDLTFSAPTLSDYLNTLLRLFLLEPLPAWNPVLRSKTPLRTGAKWHLTDPSLALTSLGISENKLLDDFQTFGYLFESLCLRDLRIYTESLGGKVFHYRDKTNLESDMVLTLRDGSWAAVEVKMGAGSFDQAAENLQKLSDRVDQARMNPPSFKMIISATEYAFQRKDGTYVVPLGCLRP